MNVALAFQVIFQSIFMQYNIVKKYRIVLFNINGFIEVKFDPFKVFQCSKFNEIVQNKTSVFA